MTRAEADTLIPEIQAIAHEHWGIEGEPIPLAGENLNVRIGEVVVKIAREPQVDPDLEEAFASALAAVGIAVPVSRMSLEGVRVIETPLGQARVQELLPGTSWQEAGDTPALLEAIGTLIARAHEATADFEHVHMHRTHAWDLAQAGQHRGHVHLVSDRTVRQAAHRALHLHAALDCAGCPTGMLHGDVNDENVLVDGEVITGLLDMGDALHGPLVCDLAIAVAYALQHAGTDLALAANLVQAYDAIRPLSETEQQCLPVLVAARLATSAVMAARQRAVGDCALQSTDAALTSLMAIAPREAERILCAGCRVHRGPGVDVDALRKRREQLLGGALSLSYGDAPLHIVAGRGQFLWGSDGLAYLDLVNNVCHVGHANERVTRAIERQARRLNTNTRYLHATVLDLAQRLVATMPEGLDVCTFVNSGSEANELALRMCRAASGANDVLVIDGAYHGCSGNCIAMSPYKFNGPGGGGCPDWVHVVPAPDTYRGEFQGEDAPQACGLEVGRVIGEAARAGRSIAGFFAESLLSCGGQVPLPAGYLEAAARHVRKAGGLYVADEVQVGFGRVGDAMWGFELHDVVPDIVVLGKPMGNGHPIGAVVTSPAVAEAFADTGMEFFSTFGGNPVSCAAALSVLETIEDEGLQARAGELGAHFKAGLNSLKERHALIGDVRGSGLFLGAELVRDHQTLEPAVEEAAAIVQAMRQHGVLLSTDGPLNNVIKIKPPLVLTRADIDMTLDLLDDVLSNYT
ncbi:MAG: aminotransferase class III-fold pyridoxal phosphate-dependent enzyme [Phycisphaerales bacterium]|nr:aminotransferase class III-fold pyridoxal phosphate-dependent enzyme [Phycisphaerales bacterium]